jgi:hypothetical protein
MSETTWVVLVSWTGDPETSEVYQTADSRAEAIEACNRLCREVPGAYAEPVSWNDAAEMGLVS